MIAVLFTPAQSDAYGRAQPGISPQPHQLRGSSGGKKRLSVSDTAYFAKARAAPPTAVTLQPPSVTLQPPKKKVAPCTKKKTVSILMGPPAPAALLAAPACHSTWCLYPCLPYLPVPTYASAARPPLLSPCHLTMPEHCWSQVCHRGALHWGCPLQQRSEGTHAMQWTHKSSPEKVSGVVAMYAARTGFEGMGGTPRGGVPVGQQSHSRLRKTRGILNGL